MSDIAAFEVFVVVALSETGQVRVCSRDFNNVQETAAYRKFLDDLKAHRELWTVKSVKVNVPLPVQYEDMTKEVKP